MNKRTNTTVFANTTVLHDTFTIGSIGEIELGQHSFCPLCVVSNLPPDCIQSREGLHTAPEQNLGLKKIVIETECAAVWRMNIRSF